MWLCRCQSVFFTMYLFPGELGNRAASIVHQENQNFWNVDYSQESVIFGGLPARDLRED